MELFTIKLKQWMNTFRNDSYIDLNLLYHLDLLKSLFRCYRGLIGLVEVLLREQVDWTEPPRCYSGVGQKVMPVCCYSLLPNVELLLGYSLNPHTIRSLQLTITVNNYEYKNIKVGNYLDRVILLEISSQVWLSQKRTFPTFLRVLGKLVHF